jgi:hypothetical protein
MARRTEKRSWTRAVSIRARTNDGASEALTTVRIGRLVNGTATTARRAPGAV